VPVSYTYNFISAWHNLSVNDNHCVLFFNGSSQDRLYYKIIVYKNIFFCKFFSCSVFIFEFYHALYIHTHIYIHIVNKALKLNAIFLYKYTDFLGDWNWLQFSFNKHTVTLRVIELTCNNDHFPFCYVAGINDNVISISKATSFMIWTVQQNAAVKKSCDIYLSFIHCIIQT